MNLHIHNVPQASAGGIQVLKGATLTILLRPVLYGLLTLLTIAVAAEPAAAQDETSEIDEIFSWATPETPGCAVAVSRLDGRLHGSRAVELTSVERDTYQRSRMMLRSRRDDAGNVVALDYSNPVLRNVTFTRRSQSPSPKR